MPDAKTGPRSTTEPDSTAEEGIANAGRRPIRRLAVLGAGTMGETLIQALIAKGVVAPADVVATAMHTARLEALESRFGIETSLDNREAAEGAEVILLCVKPQVAPGVLESLRGHLGSDQLLISIVAGLGTERMEALAGDVPVARAMPNTPSRIAAGMCAVCGGRFATGEHLVRSQEIFAHLGRCLVLDEKHFDAVTGLSASGTAFLYVVIEALAEGGVKVGLPRAVATELAAQTCLGASSMVLETGHHPALLKDAVTTPAGCTVDGLLTLEEGGLRVTLIKAVVESTRRAAELVD